jgi:hypothetical protein
MNKMFVVLHIAIISNFNCSSLQSDYAVSSSCVVESPTPPYATNKSWH